MLYGKRLGRICHSNEVMWNEIEYCAIASRRLNLPLADHAIVLLFLLSDQQATLASFFPDLKPGSKNYSAFIKFGMLKLGILRSFTADTVLVSIELMGIRLPDLKIPIRDFWTV
jgi:hypothetical protein